MYMHMHMHKRTHAHTHTHTHTQTHTHTHTHTNTHTHARTHTPTNAHTHTHTHTHTHPHAHTHVCIHVHKVPQGCHAFSKPCVLLQVAVNILLDGTSQQQQQQQGAFSTALSDAQLFKKSVVLIDLDGKFDGLRLIKVHQFLISVERKKLRRQQNTPCII